jgi:hypothetical protein
MLMPQRYRAAHERGLARVKDTGQSASSVVSSNWRACGRTAASSRSSSRWPCGKPIRRLFQRHHSRHHPTAQGRRDSRPPPPSARSHPHASGRRHLRTGSQRQDHLRQCRPPLNCSGMTHPNSSTNRCMRGSIIPRPDGSAYPADHCPIYAALHDGASPPRLTRCLLEKDGTSMPVEYVSTPITEKGRWQAPWSSSATSPSDWRPNAPSKKARSDSVQLAEHIREVFWITDPAKTRVLYISPRVRRSLGDTCESLYAMPRLVDGRHPSRRSATGPGRGHEPANLGSLQ